MSTVKDLKVRLRVNVLTSQLDPDTGKEIGQGKIIAEMPEIVVDSDELNTRLDHAALVLADGYWVDPDDVPPIPITEPVTALTATSVLLNGHVKSCSVGVAATCGFKVGLTKELGTSKAATQSPVANAASLPISYAWSGLTANTKYYYRAFATDANFSGGKYGKLKSFTTLKT